jgi:hypothetical protein
LEEDSWEDRIEEPIEDIEVESEEVVDESIEQDFFDEADLDKDGTVTDEERKEWYEKQGGWKNAYQGREYWFHPWWDWSKTERWINDRNAINYWIKHRGGSSNQLEVLKNDYPSDFTTKTY